MVEYFKCEECGKLCNIRDKVEALEHELVWRKFLAKDQPKWRYSRYLPPPPPRFEERLVEETLPNFLCPECAEGVK
jgi:hypothetical protein